MSKNLNEERIGLVRINKLGSFMEIVQYTNKDDIWVKFEKGNPVHTQWKHFEKGEVKNPYDKAVFNVGYIGECTYKARINGKLTKQYQSWVNMIQRCYDEKSLEKYPTYKDCKVTEEWLNFQNFAEWYDQNYYEVDGEKMNLDKDILVKGNKLYSPETCVFTPKRINGLFVKTDLKRGKFPIGVHWDNRDKKYIAQCSIGEKGKANFLGSYNTPEKAFRRYKNFKEELIKQIAEVYKDKIPSKLYEAMINYRVEFND